MAYPRKIRNFNAFLDGFGYAGIVTEATLPELSLNTTEFRGGGMDGPIEVDMGQQAMRADLKFAEHRPEVMTLFARRVSVTLRAGAMGEDDFEADAIEYTMRARLIGLNPDALGAGTDVMLTIPLAVDRYRITHNGAVAVDIDIEAGRRVIGGTDQLASMRAALALGSL